MEKPLNIALACGGTGGHIFPGLATADVLTQRGHNVTLWLAGKDIEREAVAGWKGAQHTIKSEGFIHGMSPKSIGTVFKLRKAYRGCKRLMRDDKPDVLLAMGSYASVGPISAALKLKVPVVLHEANVLPGRAIKWFSGRAAVVAGSFDESRHYLQKIDLVNTGMPLRLELEQAADLARNSEPDFDPFTILVMGGSRGSTRLNEIVSHALVRLKKQRHNFKVIHLTGREDEEKMMAYYAEHEISAEVKAFSTNMSPYYLAANLAICRAGAATCAELSAFGLPALLIPYPHAVHDHQTANAEAMERAKSGDLVAEANLDGQWLSEYLDGCMNTPERLNKMSAASRRRIKSRPAEALANVVEQAARHEVASEPSI